MPVLPARPLLLAKRPMPPAGRFVPRRPAPDDSLRAHIAAHAAPDPDIPGPDAAEAALAPLAAAMARTQTPATLIGAASTVIASALSFAFSAAYVVSPERPDFLVQVGAEGLPDEFREAVRMLPLCDFADIADLPYGSERTPSYGDFFAPVASQYGLRAWLVASLTDPLTLAVRGALLVGSGDPGRLAASEAVSVLSLAVSVSEELAGRFPLF